LSPPPPLAVGIRSNSLRSLPPPAAPSSSYFWSRRWLFSSFSLFAICSFTCFPVSEGKTLIPFRNRRSPDDEMSHSFSSFSRLPPRITSSLALIQYRRCPRLASSLAFTAPLSPNLSFSTLLANRLPRADPTSVADSY